jgi:hypothetical protein
MGTISLYNCARCSHCLVGHPESICTADYLIFITGRKRVAKLFDSEAFLATDFAVYPVDPTPNGTTEWLTQGNTQEKTLLGLLKAHLYGGPYYFTYGDWDITTRLQVGCSPLQVQDMWIRQSTGPEQGRSVAATVEESA